MVLQSCNEFALNPNGKLDRNKFNVLNFDIENKQTFMKKL